MDGQRLALIGLKFDSFAYIGIFLPASDRSWMDDCCHFPISKWRNPIRPTSYLGTLLPTCRKIGATDWKGHQSCPTPQWKTPCACTNPWSVWCAGCCCTTWSCCVARPRSCRSPLWIRSDQEEADTHLTSLRWTIVVPPWQTHATQ